MGTHSLKISLCGWVGVHCFVSWRTGHGFIHAIVPYGVDPQKSARQEQARKPLGIPLGKEFKCIRSWAWWLWAFISWLKLWRNNSKVARTNIYLPIPDDSSSYWMILIRPSSEVKSLEATDCRSAVLITSWVTPWGLRGMPTRATKKPKRWTGPREHRNTVWI